jgi:hypothetical protein
MHRVKVVGVVVALTLVGLGCLTTAKVVTEVTIHSAKEHQRVVGFGGDIGPWHFFGLDQTDKKTVLNFAFKDMRLNLLRCGIVNHEGATTDSFWGENDDSNPFVFTWSAFNFCVKPGVLCNDEWGALLPYIRGIGVDGEYFGLIQGPKWNGFDGSSTFSEDEMVENQLAAFIHFRDHLGISMKWVAPFSEPSGGGINWRISVNQAINVVKKLGSRLEANGFTDIRMIIPDCTSIESSIIYAKAILQDPDARKYVGAIGYHTYSTKDGTENPDPHWISLRLQLRNLAAAYRLPVRMTEYANIRGLMARANHIYNEFEFADSQTYFPMYIGGHTDHHLPMYPPHVLRKSELNPGNIVFYTVDKRGRLGDWGPTKYTGIAIGHYSRYALPGSVRLEVLSRNIGIRVQAFRNDPERKIAIVIINNKSSAEMVRFTLTDGLTIKGLVRGDRTLERSGSYWVTVTDFFPDSPNTFSLNIPRRSVTSLEFSLL